MMENLSVIKRKSRFPIHTQYRNGVHYPIMKRYNHKSHVSTIPRMKRLIKRIWTFNDLEEWKAKNLKINWQGERCRKKAER